MQTYDRAVVITGVSTGIGLGLTKSLLALGMRVFGSVRKQEDADRLAAELGARFTPLVFDVTDEKATHRAADEVRAALNGHTLFGLINNAGMAVAGPLLHLPVEEFRRQLEVNLTGVLISTQAFAPLLGADRSLDGAPGRLLNMGSVGGRNAYPFMGPYHTTKFGLEGYNESLRRELAVYGIKTVMVAPASVDTPIWAKAGEKDYSVYDKTDYADIFRKFRAAVAAIGQAGIPVERVGEAVLHALTAPQPKLRYVVSGRPLEQFLTENLPKRWVDAMIARRLGSLPPRAPNK